MRWALCTVITMLFQFYQMSYANDNSSTLAISCCDVYKAFDKFIPSFTGDSSGCTATNDCESTRLKFLLRRLQQVHGHSVSLTASTLLLKANDFDMLADMVVSRILAQYVSHEGYSDGNSLTFYFDESNHNLKEVFDACVFEKELYVALLVVSVSLLVLCLLLQLNAAQVQQKAAAARSTVDTVASYTPLVGSKTTNLRYRIGH